MDASSGDVTDMDVEARKQQYLEEQEREAVSVRVGYGEVDDDGSIKFSWKRLLVFAGVLHERCSVLATEALLF